MKSGEGIKKHNLSIATRIRVVFSHENVSAFHEVEQNVWNVLEGCGFGWLWDRLC